VASVAPAASGGDLGFALGPSPLHSGAQEVAGEGENEDEDSDAGAVAHSKLPAVWLMCCACVLCAVHAAILPMLCHDPWSIPWCAACVLPCLPALPAWTSGSVSSEGGLALEEHEAMLAVAEENVMVGAAAAAAAAAV
jgi:hypothetical protein